MREYKDGVSGAAGASGNGKGQQPESNITKIKDEKNGWYVVTTKNADGTSTITYQDENGKDIKPNSVMNQGGNNANNASPNGAMNIGNMLNGGGNMGGFGANGSMTGYGASFEIDSNEFSKSAMKFGGFASIASFLPFGMGGLFSGSMESILNSFMKSLKFNFSNSSVQMPQFNLGSQFQPQIKTQSEENDTKTDDVSSEETEGRTKNDSQPASTTVKTSTKTDISSDTSAKVSQSRTNSVLESKIEAARELGINIDSDKTYTVTQVDKMISAKNAENEKVQLEKKNAKQLKESLKNDVIENKNYEQFVAWLDKKGYKSKTVQNGEGKAMLVDYTDDSGLNRRVGFNKDGKFSRYIAYNGPNQSVDISAFYDKNGNRTSLSKRTEVDQRYSYDELTEYNTNGSKKSYKKTQTDKGGYFARNWQGAIAIEHNEMSSRKWNLQNKEKTQPSTTLPEFKSGQVGYEYNPSTGVLVGNGFTWKKLNDGQVSRTNKDTGVVDTFDKNGKLIKEFDTKKGVVKDFKKDGYYDEHYNSDWKK